MDLREILKVVPLGAAKIGPLGSTAQLEKLNLKDQEDDNWCWAAVAHAVLRQRLAAGEAVGVVESQCAIVRQRYPNCGLCKKSGCDLMGEVDEALERNGVKAPKVPKPYDFKDVLAAIRDNRPVICKVPRDASKPKGSAHVVVIRFVDEAEGTIEIRDPSKGFKAWAHVSTWEELRKSLLDLYIVQ